MHDSNATKGGKSSVNVFLTALSECLKISAAA